MDELQPVTQSEVNQKEKNKYTLMNKIGIYKNGTDEPLCRAAIEMLQMVTAAMKLKDAYSLEENLWPT